MSPVTAFYLSRTAGAAIPRILRVKSIFQITERGSYNSALGGMAAIISSGACLL